MLSVAGPADRTSGEGNTERVGIVCQGATKEGRANLDGSAVSHTDKRIGADVVDESFFSDPDKCRREGVILYRSAHGVIC